jgi:hypothetical protein
MYFCKKKIKKINLIMKIINYYNNIKEGHIFKPVIQVFRLFFGKII